MLVPDPPPEFADLVRRELSQARVRAYQIIAAENKAVPRTRKRRPPRGSCTGCGCEYDQYTEGCQPCSNRHAMRRKSLNLPKLKFFCSGCGCPTKEYNEACRTCRGRRRMHAHRASQPRPSRARA